MSACRISLLKRSTISAWRAGIRPPVELQVLHDGVEAGADAVVVDLAPQPAPRQQHGVGGLGARLLQRTLARLEGRAQDLVHRVVVGGLRVLAGVEPGEELGAAGHLRDRRIGDAEVVEGHHALAEMMPLHRLLQVPELPPRRGPEDLLVVVEAGAVDDVLVADASRGVPRGGRHLEEAVVGPHGIEQAPVVELLEEVVEVLGVEDRPAALGALAEPQPRRLLHLGDEIALQQGPGRRCADLAGGDQGHAIRIAHGSLLLG